MKHKLALLGWVVGIRCLKVWVSMVSSTGFAI